ncbi:MAG: flippase-like domain-containing protein [Proteobacteria bacterium]|nr:flippase-like domain-containing protein [Pseudomonadota bacterium]
MKMREYLLSNLSVLLKLLVGISLTGVLFYFVDLKQMVIQLRVLNWQALMLIFLSSFLLLLMQTLRLHLLIKHYIPMYFNTFRLTLIGQFFSNFLPGSVSGDVYKIYFLNKECASLTSAVTLVAIDRIIGFLLVLFFGGVYFFCFSSGQVDIAVDISKTLNFLLLFVAVILIGLSIYKTSALVQSKWDRMIANFKVECKKFCFSEFLFFLIVAVGAYFVRLLKFFVLIWAFGQSLPVVDLMLLVLIIQLVGMLPLSVGGLGLVEGSLVFGLSLFAIAPDIGLAIALVNRFIVWLFSLLGGLFWLTTKKQQRREIV